MAGIHNSQADLDNLLFAELERLSDEGLDGSQMPVEVERAKAITMVSGKLMESRKLMLQAAQFRDAACDPQHVALPKGL